MMGADSADPAIPVRPATMKKANKSLIRIHLPFRSIEWGTIAHGGGLIVPDSDLPQHMHTLGRVDPRARRTALAPTPAMNSLRFMVAPASDVPIVAARSEGLEGR